MADIQANLIVKVVDQASNALKAVRRSIDSIEKGIRDNKKEIRDFGLTATAVGGSITVALGFAVKAAREQIAVEKQLNAVLASTKGVAGLTAGEVKKMASSLQSVTNFSDDAILSSQGIILQFTKIGKEIFPQVSEAALNISQRLGKGEEGLTAIALQLGKALDNPADAMNALSRAGVQLSDSQANLIKSLAEAGKTAEAQQVLLTALEEKYGGAARAAADPLIQLKNALNDVQEEIGNALIPVLNDLLKAALPVVQKVTEWLQQNPELTKTIVLLAGALGGMLTVVGSLSLGLVAVVTALGAVGLTLAAGGVLFVAIAGIIALIVVLTQHWAALKDLGGMAIDYLVEKFAQFTTKVQEALGAVQSLIERLNIFKQIQSAAQLATFEVQDYRGPALKGRAKGGRVTEGMTLVGEQGPELVSLPRGSYVHTAQESKSMGGGSVQIGAIHVHNEADEDRLIAKLTRLIQLQSLNAA